LSAIILGCSGEKERAENVILSDNLEGMAEISVGMDYDSFIDRIESYVDGASKIWGESYRAYYLKRQPYEGNSEDIVKFYFNGSESYKPGAFSNTSDRCIRGDEQISGAVADKLDKYYKECGGTITAVFDIACADYDSKNGEVCITGPDITLPCDSGEFRGFRSDYPDTKMKLFLKAYPLIKVDFGDPNEAVLFHIDSGPLAVPPGIGEKFDLPHNPGRLECLFKLGSISGEFSLNNSTKAKNIEITVDGIPEIPVPYLELQAAYWIVESDTLSRFTNFEIDPTLAETARGFFDYFELPIPLCNDSDSLFASGTDPRDIPTSSAFRYPIIRF